MQPLVSIIIPTYNRAHLIGETLGSILNQTYKNWECIVVDDGSNDTTKELLEFYCERDSRIKYFNRPAERIKGANSCRNYGFEISKGEYINWFDDDDLMLPEKLEIQLEALKKTEPAKDFCVCRTTRFEIVVKNKLGIRHNTLFSEKPFEDYLKMHMGWLTNSVLWTRKFLLKQNYLFDEELMAAQEWEFHSRVLASSTEYVKLQKPLDLHRKHSSSITYSLKENERFWNYALARLKIYRNENIILNEDSDKFLKSYLLNSYKKMVREGNPHVLKSFWKYVYKEKELTFQAKISSFLAIWSYRCLNKGNFLMKRIKYS